MEPKKDPGTILVVDDEELAGRIVRKYFRSWRVEQAFSGWQALEMLESLPPAELRLALVDLNMPDGRAFDPNNPATTALWVVERVRKARPHVPVYVFTAYLSKPLVNAATLLGASFLVKENFQGNLTA